MPRNAYVARFLSITPYKRVYSKHSEQKYVFKYLNANKLDDFLLGWCKNDTNWREDGCRDAPWHVSTENEHHGLWLYKTKNVYLPQH